MPAISQEDWWTIHNATKNGGTLDQISDALEELKTTACQHPNTINTLDGEICEDCGKENND